MQTVGEITTSKGQPVNLGPLSFILTVSAIKDLFEDLQRHKQDNQENNAPVQVAQAGSFQITTSRHVHVGNIVKVRKDEFFPCDLLVLKTSGRKGTCFIETKNLDGETNLKIRSAHKDLQAIYTSDEKCISESGQLHYEKPNPFLYKFSGAYKVESTQKKISLNQDNFLLRGSMLRNTEYIIGVCCYSGHHTKIMLNSAKSRPKQSKVERNMNKQIVIIVGVQILMCCLCALISAFWMEDHKVGKPSLFITP